MHSVKYTVWDPSPELVAMFAIRRDMQIMGLELLAIVLGLSTFLAECRGRVVRVWTDNAWRRGLEEGFFFLRRSQCNRAYDMVACRG